MREVHSKSKEKLFSTLPCGTWNSTVSENGKGIANQICAAGFDRTKYCSRMNGLWVSSTITASLVGLLPIVNVLPSCE